jgi:4-diphosphocytidyl-2-C-methyl-D-erythritol kinase
MIVRPTAGGLEILAPAKLNLFLEVLGRRPDGYHEVETLMVTVGLHDTLTLVDDPSGGVALTCDDPTLPTGAENLVVRAAERLREASGCSRGVSIQLRKAIPAQAGLGGGSSDALATLVALDRLWELNTPSDRLDTLAGELGSDVAFFRHGPAAVAQGRGERLRPVSLNGTLHFVLVCPPVGMSTATVYRHLTLPERPRSVEPAVEALEAGDTTALGRCLFNRLQDVAEALEPTLGSVRNAFEQLERGPAACVQGHLMSGSGSA